MFIKDGKAFTLFFILAFFGADFIAFCYVVGFFFKNPDTAFKYSILVSLFLAFLPIIISTVISTVISNTDVTSFISKYVTVWLSPFGIIFNSMTSLGNSDDVGVLFIHVAQFVFQTILFLAVAIYKDKKLQYAFKG